LSAPSSSTSTTTTANLPDALSFFNGKRFVPFVVIGWSVLISLVLAIIWPVVQTGINNFGIWIADSADTAPILAPFVYGTLERLLLPFGLHHMLTIPMNYTSLGGTYTILTGAAAGSQVFGQDPLWLAWASDLVNLNNAGDTAAYNELLERIHSGPLQSRPNDRRCRQLDGLGLCYVPQRRCRQTSEIQVHVLLGSHRCFPDRGNRTA
jgi:phosphotransferase system  glucose/maltose/N-acetylglucosamine-specific IIC component